MVACKVLKYQNMKSELHCLDMRTLLHAKGNQKKLKNKKEEETLACKVLRDQNMKCESHCLDVDIYGI